MTTINKFKRLSLAKAEFPAILKDTKAFGYNYAKLEQVIDAVTPALNKYELDIIQTVVGNGVQTYLLDLIDGSKELMGDVLIDSTVVLAKMNVYQVMGSAISYFRRYQLLACLSLAQEDNDAGGAADTKAAPAKAPVKETQPVDMVTMISAYSKKKSSLKEDQIKYIDAAIDAFEMKNVVLDAKTYAAVMKALS